MHFLKEGIHALVIDDALDLRAVAVVVGMVLASVFGFWWWAVGGGGGLVVDGGWWVVDGAWWMMVVVVSRLAPSAT